MRRLAGSRVPAALPRGGTDIAAQCRCVAGGAVKPTAVLRRRIFGNPELHERGGTARVDSGVPTPYPAEPEPVAPSGGWMEIDTSFADDMTPSEPLPRDHDVFWAAGVDPRTMDPVDVAGLLVPLPARLAAAAELRSESLSPDAAAAGAVSAAAERVAAVRALTETLLARCREFVLMDREGQVAFSASAERNSGPSAQDYDMKSRRRRTWFSLRRELSGGAAAIFPAPAAEDAAGPRLVASAFGCGDGGASLTLTAAEAQRAAEMAMLRYELLVWMRAADRAAADVVRPVEWDRRDAEELAPLQLGPVVLSVLADVSACQAVLLAMAHATTDALVAGAAEAAHSSHRRRGPEARVPVAPADRPDRRLTGEVAERLVAIQRRRDSLKLKMAAVTATKGAALPAPAPEADPEGDTDTAQRGMPEPAVSPLAGPDAAGAVRRDALLSCFVALQAMCTDLGLRPVGPTLLGVGSLAALLEAEGRTMLGRTAMAVGLIAPPEALVAGVDPRGGGRCIAEQLLEGSQRGRLADLDGHGLLQHLAFLQRVADANAGLSVVRPPSAVGGLPVALPAAAAAEHPEVAVGRAAAVPAAEALGLPRHVAVAAGRLRALLYRRGEAVPEDALLPVLQYRAAYGGAHHVMLNEKLYRRHMEGLRPAPLTPAVAGPLLLALGRLRAAAAAAGGGGASGGERFLEMRVDVLHSAAMQLSTRRLPALAEMVSLAAAAADIAVELRLCAATAADADAAALVLGCNDTDGLTPPQPPELAAGDFDPANAAALSVRVADGAVQRRLLGLAAKVRAVLTHVDKIVGDTCAAAADARPLLAFLRACARARELSGGGPPRSAGRVEVRLLQLRGQLTPADAVDAAAAFAALGWRGELLLGVLQAQLVALCRADGEGAAGMSPATAQMLVRAVAAYRRLGSVHFPNVAALVCRSVAGLARDVGGDGLPTPVAALLLRMAAAALEETSDALPALAAAACPVSPDREPHPVAATAAVTVAAAVHDVSAAVLALPGPRLLPKVVAADLSVVAPRLAAPEVVDSLRPDPKFRRRAAEQPVRRAAAAVVAAFYRGVAAACASGVEVAAAPWAQWGLAELMVVAAAFLRAPPFEAAGADAIPIGVLPSHSEVQAAAVLVFSAAADGLAAVPEAAAPTLGLAALALVEAVAAAGGLPALAAAGSGDGGGGAMPGAAVALPEHVGLTPPACAGAARLAELSARVAVRAALEGALGGESGPEGAFAADVCGNAETRALLAAEGEDVFSTPSARLHSSLAAAGLWNVAEEVYAELE